MAKLSELEKREVVRLLARFLSPPQVVAEMRENWGVEIDRFQVRSYDPNNPRYEGGQKWIALFEEERAAHLGALDSIPIASKAFRLNELQRNYFKARDAGNLVLANAILAQAANEVRSGDNFVDRKNADKESSAIRDMSPEERRAKAASIINDAITRASQKNDTTKVALVA